MPTDRLRLWTDGSGTTSGPIGWGWVLLALEGDEVLATRYGGGCGHEGTNNRAELMAVVEGLRTITKPMIVEVFTDSAYIADNVNEGRLAKWLDNGFCSLTDGRPIKNADIWRLLAAECDRHNVTFTLIEGHAGHEHNERCDSIAGACRKVMVEQREWTAPKRRKKKPEPEPLVPGTAEDSFLDPPVTAGDFAGGEEF